MTDSNNDDMTAFFAQWQKQWTQIMTQPDQFQHWQKTMMEMAQTYGQSAFNAPTQPTAATDVTAHGAGSDVLGELTKRLDSVEKRLDALEKKQN